MSNRLDKQALSKKGAPNKEIWRPKSQRKESAGTVCPYCGATVNLGDAICLHCGHSLTSGKCSFCGASMKPNAKFCTKCGQSVEGVKCPQCGTLNSRTFCRKCNTPLTPRALKAIETAKNDPKFKVVEKKAEELAELQSIIEELQNATPETQAVPQLSAEDQQLINEYASLLDSIGIEKPHVKPVVKQEEAKRKTYESKGMSLDDIMKAYKEKAAEMDEALANLVPPPEFTPEEQRDYFSARKIARIEHPVPMLWKCNLCGCLHPCPSECAEPELGGQWVMVSYEEFIARGGTTTEPAKLIID